MLITITIDAPGYTAQEAIIEAYEQMILHGKFEGDLSVQDIGIVIEIEN